ncbi:MAG: TetR/AcrR family transcriptional regulator [Bacteroidota bacterium]|nr:TetR/AcrR family transcriptional regulator [Bacteroidota bacterium]
MDTRKRIIDTASRLFYQQGYNSTGINQIIDEADISKASLYQHFRSKEDLLIEYLEILLPQTVLDLRNAAATASDAPEKISAIFRHMSVYAGSKDYCGCNFLNMAGELPKENQRVYELIQRQKNEVRKLFTEILTDNKAGKDAKERAEKLADGIYLLFDGALMSCKVYGDTWPALAAQKTALSLL